MINNIAKHIKTLLLSLLMMLLGGIDAWGQTDYSGTYYIASRNYDCNPNNTDNYYLCPTEGWISYDTNDTWAEGDNNPFLTTYKCKTNGYHSGDPSNAVWIIEKHPTENYYYIRHKSDGKYMVSNGQISGTSNANRMRVHIETVAQANLDDKALFAINPYSQYIDGAVRSYLIISPKSEDGWNKNRTIDNRTQDLKWYSVNNNNQNFLYGKGKDGGPSVHKETGGILGTYTEYDANAQFYFEDVITRPTITCNTSNQIEITAAQSGTVTIKYTTDGTTPSSENGETYYAPFNLAEGITTIKAITIGTDWVSNVTTFTNHKRLIQSQNNTWNTTDFHFYMIPGDEASGITKVNTTSLFRSSMEWTFQSASVERGIHYYYIINSANSKYLCYDDTNLVYMDDFGSGGNKFKFFLVESSTYPGTFNIIPYGKNILVNKNNGNANTDPINTVGNSTNSSAISGNALWKFIQPTALDKTAPFTVCDASNHITKFYKIASVGSIGYYIVPPTSPATNATTSNSADADVVKSGTWYFEVAQAVNASDWCTYYHIRNAVTGDYLYFTKSLDDYDTNPKACLEMRSTIESSNEDRYMFTWARTATENTYYIVPKVLKDDVSLNQISTLIRDNGTLRTNITRSAGNNAWTFESTTLFCDKNPTFSTSEGNIVMNCIPGSAEIRYTTNGEDPSEDGVAYSVYPPATPLSASDQHLIKAYAVVSDGATPTPATANSPSVVTLLNKPDIVLKEGGNVVDAYAYNKTAREPVVDEVSITIGETKYTAPKEPSATYSVTYSDNMNAGTATVTISDADATDAWYIWNATKTFTITPAALTVTADAKTKEYGDADPELTYTSTGLIGEDAITGVLSRAEGENVGTYAISQGTLTAGSNYNILYTGADMTINKKSIGDGTTPAAGIVVNIDGDNNVTVKRTSPTSLALTQNTDFTVSDPEEEGGNQVWTISGIGNYTGSTKVMCVSLEFNETGENTGQQVHDVTPYQASTDMTISGLDSYIVTHINMTKRTVTIQKINYVPMDEPVLLLTDLAGTDLNYKGTVTPLHVEEGDEADTNGNLLQVSPEGGKTVGFGEVYMYYEGKFVMTTGGTLPEGKFYLNNPNPPSTSGGGGGTSHAPLRIVINNTTGIREVYGEGVMVNGQSDEWYTLDGRRLSGKPSKKGLYIWKGQKRAAK